MALHLLDSNMNSEIHYLKLIDSSKNIQEKGNNEEIIINIKGWLNFIASMAKTTYVDEYSTYNIRIIQQIKKDPAVYVEMIEYIFENFGSNNLFITPLILSIMSYILENLIVKEKKELAFNSHKFKNGSECRSYIINMFLNMRWENHIYDNYIEFMKSLTLSPTEFKLTIMKLLDLSISNDGVFDASLIPRIHDFLGNKDTSPINRRLGIRIIFTYFNNFFMRFYPDLSDGENVPTKVYETKMPTTYFSVLKELVNLISHNSEYWTEFCILLKNTQASLSKVINTFIIGLLLYLEPHYPDSLDQLKIIILKYYKELQVYHRYENIICGGIANIPSLELVFRNMIKLRVDPEEYQDFTGHILKFAHYIINYNYDSPFLPKEYDVGFNEDSLNSNPAARVNTLGLDLIKMSLEFDISSFPKIWDNCLDGLLNYTTSYHSMIYIRVLEASVNKLMEHYKEKPEISQTELNYDLDHTVNINELLSSACMALKDFLPVFITSCDNFHTIGMLILILKHLIILREDMIETILISLRKTFYVNHKYSKQISVNGFCQLLIILKIQSQLLFTQVQNSTIPMSQIWLQNIEEKGVHSFKKFGKSNETICLEILKFLKKVLHQNDGLTKYIFYSNVQEIIQKNPALLISIQQLLYEHFLDFITDNTSPNYNYIKYSKCFKHSEKKGSITVSEPINYLVQGLFYCYLKSQRLTIRQKKCHGDQVLKKLTSNPSNILPYNSTLISGRTTLDCRPSLTLLSSITAIETLEDDDWECFRANQTLEKFAQDIGKHFDNFIELMNKADLEDFEIMDTTTISEKISIGENDGIIQNMKAIIISRINNDMIYYILTKNNDASVINDNQISQFQGLSPENVVESLNYDSEGCKIVLKLYDFNMKLNKVIKSNLVPSDYCYYTNEYLYPSTFITVLIEDLLAVSKYKYTLDSTDKRFLGLHLLRTNSEFVLFVLESYIQTLQVSFNKFNVNFQKLNTPSPQDFYQSSLALCGTVWNILFASVCTTQNQENHASESTRLFWQNTFEFNNTGKRIRNKLLLLFCTNLNILLRNYPNLILQTLSTFKQDGVGCDEVDEGSILLGIFNSCKDKGSQCNTRQQILKTSLEISKISTTITVALFSLLKKVNTQSVDATINEHDKENNWIVNDYYGHILELGTLFFPYLFHHNRNFVQFMNMILNIIKQIKNRKDCSANCSLIIYYIKNSTFGPQHFNILKEILKEILCYHGEINQDIDRSSAINNHFITSDKLSIPILQHIITKMIFPIINVIDSLSKSLKVDMNIVLLMDKRCHIDNADATCESTSNLSSYTNYDRKQLIKKEKLLCTLLANLGILFYESLRINFLDEHSKTNLTATFKNMIFCIFKSIAEFYAILTMFIKYQNEIYEKFYSDKIFCPKLKEEYKNKDSKAKFEKMVQLINSHLTKNVYNYILYVQSFNKTKCKLQKANEQARIQNKFPQHSQTKGKIISNASPEKETLPSDTITSNKIGDNHLFRKNDKIEKIIPCVIYKIEEFEKHLLALSRKTKNSDLISSLKLSATRDFRIKYRSSDA